MGNAYYEYMAEYIASEISCVDDPTILSLYLTAIVAQRCKVGAAQDGTCKGCLYGCIGHHCRELYNISKEELSLFSEGMGEK